MGEREKGGEREGGERGVDGEGGGGIHPVFLMCHQTPGLCPTPALPASPPPFPSPPSWVIQVAQEIQSTIPSGV